MFKELSIVIKGAGEMASGVAWRLFQSGFRNIIMLETAHPEAVRRRVCFCEAVYDGTKTIAGVNAILAHDDAEIDVALEKQMIAVVIDPTWKVITRRKPKIIVDAILAKKNLGTSINEAELVVGLGPGFEANKDVNVVVETNRGPNCGRLLYAGTAEKNTGKPSRVMGFDIERVVRSPGKGVFKASKDLDEQVEKGDVIGYVNDLAVIAAIDGSLRGLIRSNISVTKMMKIGDIEPREGVDNLLVSDKSLGLGGAVLEAILHKFND
ncbi:MAG: selenium-dependent molybdenum cofactor biosynthesis protein YqeB [Desulfotalea sp.]